MASWLSSVQLKIQLARFVKLASAVGLVGGVLSVQPLAFAEPVANKPNPSTVAGSLFTLPDGAYQFCTEPAPQDWRDGAGACLTWVKQGTAVSGYYDYPHSESFICLKGRMSETGLSGTGMAISFSGHPWSNVPGSSFYWDNEGRLFLAEGDWVRQAGETGWIVFQQATLNTEGLYQYEALRMTLPEQLCDWEFGQ